MVEEFQWGPRDIANAAREVAALVGQSNGNVSEKEAIGLVVQRHRELPPIRLIPFETFESLKELPRLGMGLCERFPNAPGVDLTVPLTSVDREISFMIFVSHCLIASWDGQDEYGNVIDQATKDEWRGYPHPDTKSNDKFKLLVEAIKRLRDNLAPGCPTYIWLDFSCMDQNGNPAGELKQLDKIVEMCDCLLTVIVDPDHATAWDYPSTIDNWFTQYRATRFNEGRYAYVNRAWCRVEMLYAANIPLKEGVEKKDSNFRAGLLHAMRNDFRPHYLYGDKEKSRNTTPIQLPPLANSHLQSLSPVACIKNLTCPTDAEKIRSLMEDLKPYLKEAKEGYEGDLKDGKYDKNSAKNKGSFQHSIESDRKNIKGMSSHKILTLSPT